MDEVANYSFDVLVQDEQLCLEGLLNDVAFDFYDPDSFSDLNFDQDSNSDSGCSTSCVLSPGLSSQSPNASSESSPPQSPPSPDRCTPPTSFCYPHHFVPNLLLEPAVIPAVRLPVLAPVQHVITAAEAAASRMPFPAPAPVPGNADDKLQKHMSVKEARKIRNREASLLSRKKQKETLGQLQARNALLEQENQHLKSENTDLKKRISMLEDKMDQIRRPGSQSQPASKRKAVGLLAVVFLIGMNVAPYGIFPAPDRDLSYKSSEKTGRSLLWVPDYDDADFRDAGNTLLNVTNMNSSLPINCGKMINTTETQRVESELRGWVKRLEKQKLRSNEQRRKAVPRPFKKPIPLTPVETFLLNSNEERGGRANHLFPLTVRKNMDSLLRAIHRRDDTYYFVSLSPGDHMLLAAGVNRTNVRPRFSLVMPALSSVTETSTTYTMMQIDCEVLTLNTETLLVKNFLTSDTVPTVPLPVPHGKRLNMNKRSPLPRNSPNMTIV